MEKGGWVRFKEWCFWSRGCERKIWMIDSADSSMPALRLESWKKHGELNGCFLKKKNRSEISREERKKHSSSEHKRFKKKTVVFTVLHGELRIPNSLQTTDAAFFWRTWGTWQVQPIKNQQNRPEVGGKGTFFPKNNDLSPNLKKLSKFSQIFVCFPPFLWGRVRFLYFKRTWDARSHPVRPDGSPTTIHNFNGRRHVAHVRHDVGQDLQGRNLWFLFLEFRGDDDGKLWSNGKGRFSRMTNGGTTGVFQRGWQKKRRGRGES